MNEQSTATPQPSETYTQIEQHFCKFMLSMLCGTEAERAKQMWLMNVAVQNVPGINPRASSNDDWLLSVLTQKRALVEANAKTIQKWQGLAWPEAVALSAREISETDAKLFGKTNRGELRAEVDGQEVVITPDSARAQTWTVCHQAENREGSALLSDARRALEEQDPIVLTEVDFVLPVREGVDPGFAVFELIRAVRAWDEEEPPYDGPKHAKVQHRLQEAYWRFTEPYKADSFYEGGVLAAKPLTPPENVAT